MLFPQKGIRGKCDLVKNHRAYARFAVGIRGIALIGSLKGPVHAEAHAAVYAEGLAQAQGISPCERGGDIALDCRYGNDLKLGAGTCKGDGEAIVNAGVTVDDDGSSFHSGSPFK